MNIDSIDLRNILNCSERDRFEIREIRNQSSVRENMTTNHIISFTEHQNWLRNLGDNPEKNKVFLVYFKDRLVGSVGLNHIDVENKTASWSFQLDQTRKLVGLGLLMEFKILDYYFLNMQYEKLNGEVLETNPGVLRLHEAFGFTREGFVRFQFERNQKRIGLVLIGMTRDEWLNNRTKVSEKYLRRK